MVFELRCAISDAYVAELYYSRRKYIHHLVALRSYLILRHLIFGASSVGIATRYGLDDPGIESERGRDIPHLSRQALEPTQPPVQWVPGISGG